MSCIAWGYILISVKDPTIECVNHMLRLMSKKKIMILLKFLL